MTVNKFGWAIQKSCFAWDLSDWDQSHCYRFTGAKKENCVVSYVDICPELWEIF